MKFLNFLNIENMYLTISCFTFILCLNGVSTDNMTDYINQLELKISNLESHTLASEQKQTAVLSTILARIQSQDQKIQSQEREIQSQKQTIQSQDQKMQELKTELENATKTDYSLVSSSGHPPVVFEVSTSHALDPTTRIHFDQISTNVGGAYSSNTDVFTAPRNGIYQIWFKVNLDLYYSGGQGPVLNVEGGAGPTIYGSYVAPEQNSQTRHHHYKVLQDVLAVTLLEGDPVYLTLGPSKMFPYTKIKPSSTFGGVFLGDM